MCVWEFMWDMCVWEFMWDMCVWEFMCGMWSVSIVDMCMYVCMRVYVRYMKCEYSRYVYVCVYESLCAVCEVWV